MLGGGLDEAQAEWGGQIKVRRGDESANAAAFWCLLSDQVRLSESRVAIKPGGDPCLRLRDLAVDPFSFEF